MTLASLSAHWYLLSPYPSVAIPRAERAAGTRRRERRRDTLRHFVRLREILPILAVALGASGCVSLGGGAPGEPRERPFPRASRPRGAELQWAFRDTFNGEDDEARPPGEDGAEDDGGQDEERRACESVVKQLVLESDLVGYEGQEGLRDTRLVVEVHRDVSASILHGLGSALTIFLFPYWIEVSYEVGAELREGAVTRAYGVARDSWHVLVNPFLVFAMPFDEPVEPVRIVERLARRALGDVVLQAERDEQR